MKMYKHEYDSYKQKVNTYEIEVEEKPKTYIVTQNVKGAWESRIFKTDIDKLEGRLTPKMFSLTPDPTPFIKALIEHEEFRIKTLKEQLNKVVANKTILLKIYDDRKER